MIWYVMSNIQGNALAFKNENEDFILLIDLLISDMFWHVFLVSCRENL